MRAWGGGHAGLESPILGGVLPQCCSAVVSEGLIVAHVPDLGSLGFLMQQCEAGQVF